MSNKRRAPYRNNDEKEVERKKSIDIKKQECTTLELQIQEMLDSEQKVAFDQIHKNSLTVILGAYGTGKTALACAYAALGLKRGEFNKVFISRPTFTQKSEDIGFLPGEVKDKMRGYVLPMLQNFEKFFSRTELEYYISSEQIEMLPTMYFRGINIGRKQLLICDEVQNMSSEAMKKTVTRIAKGGKIILMGDRKQCDLRKGDDSGLLDIVKFKHPLFSTVELTINHRDPIVAALREFYEGLESGKV
jgi:phosphate starvation-inducible protein PhoH and related proteins